MSNLQLACAKSFCRLPRALGKADTLSMSRGSLGMLAKMKPFMHVECACMSMIMSRARRDPPPLPPPPLPPPLPPLPLAQYFCAASRIAWMVGAVPGTEACQRRLRSRPTELQR